MTWLEKYRKLVILLLVVRIVAGAAVFVYRQNSVSNSTEIAILPPSSHITVYVEGEVNTPGVYKLNEGSLVADAIEAAGGFSSNADHASVNLAASVRDASHIHVYRLGDVPQKVDINTAEAWLLQPLPGIGETLANRIIDYRTGNGPFQETEELMKVEGIGTRLFEQIREKITVR
jgi:competence protein ComEA